MFRSGLLVLTAPLQKVQKTIPAILEGTSKYVKETLYVHLAPNLQTHVFREAEKRNVSENQLLVPLTIGVQELVSGIYITASNMLKHTDVRVLVGNINQITSRKQSLAHGYEVLLTDNASRDIQDHVQTYASVNFPNGSSVPLYYIDEKMLDLSEPSGQLAQNMETVVEAFDHVAMGGTFDGIHGGHKVLLNVACLLCTNELLVGVTDGALNQKKTISELLHPTTERIQFVKDFLEDVKPGIRHNVVPITDPCGPAIVIPQLKCLVVSRETVKGGEIINTIRKEKGMDPLHVHVIDLVKDVHREAEEEEKISSSSFRKRLLGTLLRESKTVSSLPSHPYIIGLTGGIACGKSSVAKRLEKLGAGLIDCDKLGHAAYLKGTETFNQVVAAFGQDIVDVDGQIDRKKLGAKVFSDKAELEKLNAIVWPAIAVMAKEQIKHQAEAGKQVVCMEAAVLLEAGWDKMVHEVWICIVPKEEAVQRIINRNNITREMALQRIESQMTNHERVQQGNVVLSTLWAPEITQEQVEKSWSLLQERICNVGK